MTLPYAEMPAEKPAAPSWALPEGACDAHVHMVAGPEDFALWDARVENPAPGPDFDGWLARFQAHLDTLGFDRTVFVHSILYGGDNAVTLEAVRRFGDRARGVCLLPDGSDARAIQEMADAKMKAVRLNYVHGGLLTWEGALAMAPALTDAGMHIQMLAHADRHMPELADGVRAAPCPVVFDHCGWPADGVTAESGGFRALLALVSEGHAWVKLSATYRVSPDWTEAAALVEALVRANPERCLWGSDWPHLMLGGAEMPDAGALLNAFLETVPDSATRRQILVTNPERLFGF
ncbi:MAG: amidohydrolase family protein [Paracoccaceae bacterium]|nr:amidohydrolase family protein [Paracoccaceae bacterium]